MRIRRDMKGNRARRDNLAASAQQIRSSDTTIISMCYRNMKIMNDTNILPMI